MEAFYLYLNNLFNKNRQDFRDYPAINWLNAWNGGPLADRREKLLGEIGDNTLFKGTKPYYNRISKGCLLCGQGRWSCLFITSKCNGKCFYCPAEQTEDAVPSTQSLQFENPVDYAEYVNLFGFKGVSFSGGEPLLYFDRTLSYLKAVRKFSDPGIYTWMYTNGMLGTKQLFRKLATTGLNEVRFDIGATGYRLDKIAEAKGTIPNITIEIPAIPEETEKLKTLLPEMIKAGVTNLNLHQLRLTSHNAPHLLRRNYTYFPSERPVVVESELAALEILAFAKKNGLDIGINYCSFDYKNRFQKAGFRKQLAAAVVDDLSSITENGYIRNHHDNMIGYSGIAIRHEAPEGDPEAIEVNSGNKKYYITKPVSMPETIICESEKDVVEQLLSKDPKCIPEDEPGFTIWQHEYIERGLRAY